MAVTLSKVSRTVSVFCEMETTIDATPVKILISSGFNKNETEEQIKAKLADVIVKQLKLRYDKLHPVEEEKTPVYPDESKWTTEAAQATGLLTVKG